MVKLIPIEGISKYVRDFEDTLAAARDRQVFEANKEKLIAAARLITEGGMAREVTAAIEEGPEAVRAVLKRYKKEIISTDKK